LTDGSLPFPGATADFLANPYPTYQRMRAETPILAHGGPAYLTRYKDVAFVLRDERFVRLRAENQAAEPAPAASMSKLAEMRRQSEQAPPLWPSI
jgi:cytochrome P450